MLELVDDTFEDTVKSGAVLVDFYTDWCHPCKMISGVLENLSKEFPNVVFAKLNAENYPKLSKQYSIQSVPTIILFKNGVIVNTIVGSVTTNKIKESLKEIL